MQLVNWSGQFPFLFPRFAFSFLFSLFSFLLSPFSVIISLLICLWCSVERYNVSLCCAFISSSCSSLAYIHFLLSFIPYLQSFPSSICLLPTFVSFLLYVSLPTSFLPTCIPRPAFVPSFQSSPPPIHPLPIVGGESDQRLSIWFNALVHSSTQADANCRTPAAVGDLPPHISGLVANSWACFWMSLLDG